MAQTEIDANLSNGTCYSAQWTATNGDFIPCGNTALGNWPCCKTGDACLGFETANACYDAACQSLHTHDRGDNKC